MRLVTELLEQNAPRVYRYALQLTGRRHLAEDLTQETLLRAWRSRGQLKEDAAIVVWLFRIATNIWRDWGRQKTCRIEATSLESEPRSTGPSPRELASHREAIEKALEAMAQLPGRQREVLYLFACEGLKLAEIAEVLDIQVNAAKVSLCHARRKMREQASEFLVDPQNNASHSGRLPATGTPSDESK